jgi:collagen type VII alpha
VQRATRTSHAGRRRFLRTATGAAAGALVAAGPAAAAGRRPALLSGRGAPRRAVGRAGDFYFDVATAHLYGPKRRAAWGKPLALGAVPEVPGQHGSGALPGPAGAAGPRGATGPQGARGPTGAPGPTGAAGADGAIGPTGPTGSFGPTGEDGERGPTGPQGARGFSVLTSSGPPPSSLGIDGDYCIDVASTQIYGPKDDGVWGSPTSLTGPPGDAAPLRALAATPEALVVGVLLRDAGGAVVAADVLWPDGTPGRYTGTSSTDVPGAVDAYEITYGKPPTRTYRQPPVTRDGLGAVVHRPPIMDV